MHILTHAKVSEGRVTNDILQMKRSLYHLLSSKENSPPCISHKPSLRLKSVSNDTAE